MKKLYRTKNRKNGYIYTSVSKHAEKRMKERGVNILNLLSSLCQVSEELCQDAIDGKNVVVVNLTLELAAILHVSRNHDGPFYLNVITVLGAQILEKEDVDFYGINKLIAV